MLLRELSKLPQTTSDFQYLKSLEISHIPLLVWERKQDCGAIGVVTRVIPDDAFNKWAINLLLSTSKIMYPPSEFSHQIYTDIIVELFETMLKNTAAKDKWEEEGESYFKTKVDFYTSKGLKIEAVLPAFPCKSSNPDKVSGYMPDKGEEMALRTLCDFASAVKKVYPPGILIWIVSDGHVFSDCIGVDDLTVNAFGFSLKELYHRINTSGEEMIRFCSLIDLFNLHNKPVDEEILDEIHLSHHIATEIDPTSENCRKILMKSCDTDWGQLKEDINTPNHPRLFLFRGFSKFMEEDLKQHPTIIAASKKKSKKIVAKIAFEMIKRNDAYSNLMELIFPMHLRFSIHAHTNSGPKYGIKLLSNKHCRVINSLEECSSPNYDDLLHIPTPWHNTVLKIEGDSMYYVTKTNNIMKAIQEGTYTGGWDKKSGCFELKARSTA
ncbi:hypothetical protein CANTEDRAFT_100455 [Yamadazyma tenuis ATCC 10573]|uniref:Pyoverdine/dityrosine biosynthesis protein n=2 Tax=Candida tenuis TaxID=2315449 RepID=G3AW35_CANTC|nr:uncharacterized protein CANTEDRAFT_100455 [Yamadazyma tenuis ATCC 10573]EGV66439.1 hypothetical protein CANTEDRAFT_100455 [Yamadazyma tenuis ATCC 10573]